MVLFQDEHADVFGRQSDVPALLKIKLIQIDRKLRALWEGRERLHVPQYESEKRQWFKDICGFDHRSVRGWEKEIVDNDGYACDPQKRGRKPRYVEEEYPDLEQWVEGEIDKAIQPGGNMRIKLTTLLEDFWAQKEVYVPEKQFRHALRRLGFKYSPQQQLFLSKRAKPEVQRELRDFCEFVVSNTEQVPSKYTAGRQVWNWKPNCHVAYTDASWLHSGMFDRHLWTKKKRTLDARGRGVRVALLDAIFPHILENKSCRVFWNTRLKKKHGRTFFGNVTGELTRAHVQKIFEVFRKWEQFGTVICDNATVYKEFKEKLSKMSDAELLDWIMENDPNVVEFNTLYQTPGNKDRRWLMDYVKEHNLRTILLQELAGHFFCAVRFLPAYHPECNAIEKVWRLVKNTFRKQDPQMTWEQRLDMAYAAVTPQYIEAIIGESIAWCRKQHGQFEAAGVPADGGLWMVENDDEDNPDDLSDDGDGLEPLDMLAEL